MRFLYTCPVCAYPEMTEPVHEGNICPCCGTEFGYDDDLNVTYGQLRNLWIERGMPWFSPVVSAPYGWDPIIQMIEGDLDVTAESNTTNRVDSEPLELVG